MNLKTALFSLINWISWWIPPIAKWRQKTARDYSLMAGKAYEAGENQQALEYYQSAVSWNPKDADLRCDLGQYYFEQSLFKQAEEQYRHVLKKDWSNLRALKNLGYLLHSTGRFNDAMFQYLNLAYLTKNQDAEVLLNLGASLDQLGEYDRAIDYYKKAKALAPEDPLIHENLGGAFYSMGRIQEAIESLEESLRIDPTNTDLQLFLGRVLRAEGKKERAANYFNKAVEADSQNAEALSELALDLIEQKRYQESLTHLLKAMEISEQRNDSNMRLTALWNLGWTYYLLGDFEKSAASSRKALDVNPQQGAVRANLALALLRQGKIADAEKEYKQAAASFSSANELAVYVINDLKETIENHPDLEGAAEIVRMLDVEYAKREQESKHTSSQARSQQKPST